jgi:Family of unknown function (DUF6599)
MKVFKFAVSVAFIIGLMLISCGGSEKASSSGEGSGQYLPSKFEKLSMVRDGDAVTYVGETLYEYINGGAELYHLYNFIDVTTATYRNEGTEITVDIYRFDNSPNAYGLYTLMRPEEPNAIKIGIEGFSSPLSMDFVKGEYLVRLTGYEESSETFSGIRILAAELETVIPGTKEYPKIFSKFPEPNKIAYTAKHNVESYLGHGFLSNVYTQDYNLNGETVTLFLTEDSDGVKFVEWELVDKTLKSVGESLVAEAFDDYKVFHRAGGFYGDIIAGLKKKKLVGILNYSSNQEQFLIDWLNSIK